MSDAGTVIVGAGQAGLQTAASLRELGYAAPITLIGDEAALPYQRPPLSKAYLAGKTDAQGLLLRPASFLDEHRIALRTGLHAERIDRQDRRLHLSDGTRLGYDHLVLATGSRNRALPVPGADQDGVYQLRSLEDADRLRAVMGTARRVVVIGAGFIGLEFAAVCAGKGLDVTVIEAAGRVMARAVSPETSAWFKAAHERSGLRFELDAGVVAIVGQDGIATGVTTASGQRLPADLVLIGIGVVPNQELAATAGLAVHDGVEVDAFLATVDPNISAVGDCARFPTRYARDLPDGNRVRIESVQNAIDQGRCVAARLTGRANAYDAVPWFWSDQGPHKLQIAGLAAPADASVVRGQAEAFSVFRFREGALCAVESVNRPGDHMAARRILSGSRRLSPDDAANPAFDLKAYATSRL